MYGLGQRVEHTCGEEGVARAEKWLSGRWRGMWLMVVGG